MSFGIESNDFSGADKGEIKRVKEEKDILAFIAADVNVDEVSIVPGLGFEVRGWFSDQ